MDEKVEAMARVIYESTEPMLADEGQHRDALAAARAEERERCAKVAEGVSTFEWRGGDEWAAGYVDGKNAAAAAIRAGE